MTLFPQQLEHMGPAGASEAWDAPQDTERFDCARALDGAHVGNVMAELFENGPHLGFRRLVVCRK
jgi:hypothetical protein